MIIRKAFFSDVKGIAKVHVDSWKTTYQNIVPDDYLQTLTYVKREQLWERVIPNGNVFVAQNENGEIIGFADGGKERTGKYGEYPGELYAIYILESWQGKGIGRQLVDAVAGELGKQGIDSMLVWVLKDNKSRYFYERLGAVLVDQEAVDFGGVLLNELAYGFKKR